LNLSALIRYFSVINKPNIYFMKRMTLQILVTFLVAIAISFSSCSKEGPVGPQGEQGPQGAQGAQGSQGDPGTANVIYSNWLNVSFDADTVHNGAVIDTIGFYSTIEAAGLDNSILTSGEIKVFLNLGTADDAYVVPLPYFSPYNGITIEPSFYVGNIDIYSNIDAGTAQDQSGNIFQQYRYILIPGGTAARKSGSQVDWNDYASVKKYLNLKD
jgi:hypothetical protein